MRCPISVSITAWFVVGFGVLFLTLTLASVPVSPEAEAALEAGPHYGWLYGVTYRMGDLALVAAGGLVLRGDRRGRMLFLVCGPLVCVLVGLPRGAQLHPLMTLVPCLLATGVAVAVWMLFRRPARQWLGLAPALRVRVAWRLRGVPAVVILSAAGALLAAFLFASLCDAAAWLADAEGPALDRLGITGVLAAVSLAVGLALGPWHSAGRRLSIVVLCASLVALAAVVWAGASLLTPVMVSGLPLEESAERLGYAALEASPVLLLPVLACVLRLRRASPDRVAPPA